MVEAAPQGLNTFFYGTLMHPKILARVIGNPGDHLRFCPAVLFGHTRHSVKDGEYPGIIPYSDGVQLFQRELSQEEASVRGTLVTGLTEADIALLDLFEGDEYTRSTVEVRPLSELEDFNPSKDLRNSSFIPAQPPPLPEISQLLPGVQADTYIFLRVDHLEPELWSFEDFVAKNSRKWYSSDWDSAERSEPSSRSDNNNIEQVWEGNDVRGSIIERRMAAQTLRQAAPLPVAA